MPQPQNPNKSPDDPSQPGNEDKREEAERVKREEEQRYQEETAKREQEEQERRRRQEGGVQTPDAPNTDGAKNEQPHQ